ncbi:MAG: hypothetical protein ACLUD2_03135 [Clostridium sp.]
MADGDIHRACRVRRYRSYRRHRNMWFVILGVLLVLLLYLWLRVCGWAGSSHKRRRILQDQPTKREQTGSTGAYENVELVTRARRQKS